MEGTGVNHVCHTQLLDPSKALKPGMFDQVEQERIGYCNESVNRIVEDFSTVEGGMPHLCSIFVLEKRFRIQ
jgi:hypothetical protein